MTDVDALLLAHRSAPGLDPASTVGVSQGVPPSQVRDAAQATFAFGSASKFRGYLEDQDSHVQRSVWATLDASQQHLLRAAGYSTPAAHSPSIFERAASTVGHGLSDVGGSIAHGAGETLHALGAPLRGVQHAYRAASLMTDQNVSEGRGQMSLHGVLSPAEWARHWRESTHGESTFSPVAMRDLEKKYDPGTLDLAKSLASGTKLEDLTAGMPDADKAAFVRRVQGDANLQAAVGQLQNAKISFGRRLVGRNLLDTHPLLGKVLAGSADAVGDFFGDPIIIGSKFAKGVEVARYLVRDAEDVQRLVETNAAAQRYISQAGNLLAEGKVGRLIEIHPELAPVSEELVKSGVDSPQKLAEWMQSKAGLTALFDGRVSGFARGETMIPHLTAAGSARLAVKTALKDTIDFAADKPSGMFNGPGTFARRLLTLTPKATSFEPNSPEAITNVQRIASYVLPAKETRQLVDAWAAAPDLGAKKQLYKGLLGEVFRAAKVDQTPEGQAWMSRWLDTLDENLTTRMYSTGTIDKMNVAGKTAGVGILEPHLTDEWGLPSFRALWANSRRASVSRRLFGAINNDTIDTFMAAAWKPMTLLRLGFPVRAGGEELIGQVLREGLIPTVKARLAAGAVKDTPGAVGFIFGERAGYAFRNVEGKLAGERYRTAAQELYEHGPLRDAFADEITAAHGRAGGYLDDPESLTKLTRDGHRVRPAQLVPNGDYRAYAPTETLYTQVWARNLDEVAKSRLARVVLKNHGDSREELVQKVADFLDEPGFAKMRARGLRAHQLRDGAQVGVDATARQASEDWANVVIDHVDSLVRDSKGEIIGDLPARLAAGDAPLPSHLNEIPVERRPSFVRGQDVLPVSRNVVSDVIGKGFENVVGRPMDWMVRQPMFIHNYAKAKDAAEILRPLVENEDVLREIAVRRAVIDTIPFIHDPHLKAQSDVIMRNLSPFMFAQRQFFVRWARTFSHSPEALREAQLTMMGLRHSGVLHTDDQGNDYFMYPAVGAVQGVLTKAFEKLTGHPISLPITPGFSGQVRFATPGLERLGLPSFGPLVGIPTSALARRFPELADLEQGILGERGAGRSYWEQITPTTLSRIYHVLADNPETSPQMHSAAMQAIQYLEATGHGLREDATPDEVEHWQDRVKAWTRTLFLTRTLYGYAAPAAPELQFDPNHLNEEFRQLQRSLPIEDAVKEFIRRHPDGTPYTVFQTKSASGAPLPATEGTMRFMEKHNDFIQSYPTAGGWFLPQESPDKKFSMPAYREQLALELRKRKTLDQFVRDIKFSEAADSYFNSKERYDSSVAAARSNGDDHSEMDHDFAQWKKGFLTAHPIFAQQLESSDGPVRRKQTLLELKRALNDPRVPESPQTENMRKLVRSFDRFQQYLGSFAGLRDSDSVEQRASSRADFTSWAIQFVTDHPEVKALYDRVIRLEVGQ